MKNVMTGGVKRTGEMDHSYRIMVLPISFLLFCIQFPDKDGIGPWAAGQNKHLTRSLFGLRVKGGRPRREDSWVVWLQVSEEGTFSSGLPCFAVLQFIVFIPFSPSCPGCFLITIIIIFIITVIITIIMKQTAQK